VAQEAVVEKCHAAVIACKDPELLPEIQAEAKKMSLNLEDLKSLLSKVRR